MPSIWARQLADVAKRALAPGRAAVPGLLSRQRSARPSQRNHMCRSHAAGSAPKAPAMLLPANSLPSPSQPHLEVGPPWRGESRRGRQGGWLAPHCHMQAHVPRPMHCSGRAPCSFSLSCLSLTDDDVAECGHRRSSAHQEHHHAHELRAASGGRERAPEFRSVPAAAARMGGGAVAAPHRTGRKHRDGAAPERRTSMLHLTAPPGLYTLQQRQQRRRGQRWTSDDCGHGLQGSALAARLHITARRRCQPCTQWPPHSQVVHPARQLQRRGRQSAQPRELGCASSRAPQLALPAAAGSPGRGAGAPMLLLCTQTARQGPNPCT